MASSPLQLEVGSLVIADLHLAIMEPEDVRYFVDWLAGLDGVPQLLILGDLFDYWVGMAQARFEATSQAVAALAARVAQGTGIEIILGNRDFLLDARFERLSGCRIHEEGILARTPDGTRVYFLHGDQLCTLDHRYQRMRRVLRSGPVRWIAPRLPGLAEMAARRLRKVSKRELAKKEDFVVDQQEEAAASWVARMDADLLVCGHAHSYREVPLGQARWVVLDAFGGQKSVLEVFPGGELGVSSRLPASPPNGQRG